MTILDEIAAYTRERIRRQKTYRSTNSVRREAEEKKEPAPSFLQALKKPELSFILECKKASPSKGLIAPDFPYLSIAKEYEAAGADAISVLTEPKWFLGKDSYLSEITRQVGIPCLRKDFTVDPYMIFEARTLGASAVLLIVSILSAGELEEYRQIAESLGMDALVETHDEEEIETALSSGAKIIGVNNRNLHDFSVDTKNSEMLSSRIPDHCIFVSESGVKTASDIEDLRRIGADACLIGETLMRAEDKRSMLKQLKGEL